MGHPNAMLQGRINKWFIMRELSLSRLSLCTPAAPLGTKFPQTAELVLRMKLASIQQRDIVYCGPVVTLSRP